MKTSQQFREPTPSANPMTGAGWLLFTLAVIAWPGTAMAQQQAQKYALMIGVTTYDHAVMNGDRPLKFPEDDARALGKLLEQHDYEVEYLLGEQATREAVITRLEGLTAKGNAAGVCVVGLFGHGVEMEFPLPDKKGKQIQGCFCPFDTGVRQVVNADGQKQFGGRGKPQLEPIPDSLVKMSEVVSALGLAKAGSRLLIADCCREMPNRPRGRNLGLGANFSTDRLPSQTAMLFGCRPGEQALERDDWQHGAFTKSLLEVMSQMASSSDPVTSGTLADRVKRRVQQLTSNQQNPTPISLDSIDLLMNSSAELTPAADTQLMLNTQTAKKEADNRGDSRKVTVVDSKIASLPEPIKSWLQENTALLEIDSYFNVVVIEKKRMAIAIGSALIENSDDLTAQKKCRLRANAARTKSQNDVNIKIREEIKDDRVSESIISSVEAKVRSLPAVGSWTSSDGKRIWVLYADHIAVE
ncbi:MAG: caspase family protein [Pirellulaceae bacterium]|nr:caspase family protein [Pirellulaceae bacterium]